ncbi:lipase family protein [Nocardia yamanashiensis]|uniref:lipase family protein n=1 Tax=Nocardia yamanashiensis TaxID=209247 RepID=UPI001E30D855|nr:lipase family protein [Nocardia yamanashiensis]UGT44667.1 lipase family protein [Nocardia yamanashiensis]
MLTRSLSILALCCAALTTLAPAHAEPVAATDFYNPPSPLPTGNPGDVIRAEPAEVAVPFPARATRVLYRSIDPAGAAVAVSGIVFDPVAAWSGPGERPLVSFSAGTQGQGDQCAPSRLFGQLVHYTPPLDLMAEYEITAVGELLARGAAVVVTDYQGLGTPGTHTFLNAEAEAHAVIDAARAAQRLPGTGIPAAGPVLFWGFSQGGHAAGAAAERVGTYAPELDLRASYVGAVPGDLMEFGSYADGTALSGAFGYLLNSMRTVYPDTIPVLDAALNGHGRAVLADTAGQCAGETVLRYAFQHTSSWTADGRPLFPDVIASDPRTLRALDDQRLGNRRPTAPVLLLTGPADDIVPASGVRALAERWCAQGTPVQLLTLDHIPTLLPGTILGHGLDSVAFQLENALPWLDDRLADRPAPSTC